MSTDESGESKNTKRCSRCETEKHRREFGSTGYCTPCQKAYFRERDARRKGSNPLPPKASKPVPPASPPPAADVPPTAKPTTIGDVARNVEARAAAPRETPAPLPAAYETAMISDPSRHRRITRSLAEALLAALEDGETLSVTVSRFGQCIVIDDIGVSREDA